MLRRFGYTLRNIGVWVLWFTLALNIVRFSIVFITADHPFVHSLGIGVFGFYALMLSFGFTLFLAELSMVYRDTAEEVSFVRMHQSKSMS